MAPKDGIRNGSSSFFGGMGGWEINTGKEEEGLNGEGIEIKRTGE